MKLYDFLSAFGKGLVFFAGLFLFVTSANCAEITLVWDKPPGEATGYYIYYGESGTDYRHSPRIVIDNADETRSVIPDLVDGESYSFVMSSFDDHGNESDFSEEIYYGPEDIERDISGDVDSNTGGGGGGGGGGCFIGSVLD